MNCCLFPASLLAAVAFSAPVAIAQAETAKPDKKKPPSREELVKKIEQLQHEALIAELKLRMAELDTNMKRRAGIVDLTKKKTAVQVADSALARFLEHDKQIQLRDAEIKRDSSKYSAEHAKDELSELEAMYKAEEFAELTKELVLRRGRRNLELAQRRLAVAEARVVALAAKLKAEATKLRVAAEHARLDVDTAELALGKKKIEGEIARTEAKFKVASNKRDLAKAIRDLEKSEQEKKEPAGGKDR